MSYARGKPSFGGHMTNSESKNVIVYFTRTGNTQAIAELIHKKRGGDLFKIETRLPYPIDYQQQVAQNVSEQTNDVLPSLKTKIINFAQYEIVFIGIPTWNMALPQPVISFIKQYDWRGKTVIPFNTNGGYGPGTTFAQIQNLITPANLLPGLTIKGGEEINGKKLVIKDNVRLQAEQQVNDWLYQLNLPLYK